MWRTMSVIDLACFIINSQHQISHFKTDARVL